MTHYDRKDKFYQMAKEEGYPSRAAYKLIELNKKYRILKTGNSIIDLGCAPGGWLKVLNDAPLFKVQGVVKVVGVDYAPITFTPRQEVAYIQGDFTKKEVREQTLKTLGGKAHWVISDMAPKLTGIKFKDMADSYELVRIALDFAFLALQKGGGFICKIFPGPDAVEIIRDMKRNFERFTQVNLDSTRKTSDETYLVTQGFKGRKD
ncbi:RlmE family RNA methyltransferase [bacterium]|nr:RlmE family RNA methyltransferase [bacterium]